ncbi:hypothetical protein HPB47_014731, partial [Ixodes persulcatus]
MTTMKPSRENGVEQWFSTINVSRTPCGSAEMMEDTVRGEGRGKCSSTISDGKWGGSSSLGDSSQSQLRRKDYGTPSNPALLDMVKVMAFALGEGKVAVHCHAGLGRTGLLISCYLVYALRCRPNDAIRYVRLKRHGSVQTQAQIGCVQKFAQFLLPLFIVYPVVQTNRRPSKSDKYRPAKAVDFTLSHYLLKQRQVLHGLEGRHLKYIPKVESKLRLHRITSQIRQYEPLIDALSPQAATEVRDIVLSLLGDTPYDTLKEARQRRLQLLLSAEELGDRRPSQFLRHLQHLLGDKAASIDTA